MGSIWLDGRTPHYPNVLDVLRNAGVPVIGEPGWTTRSRSSGGFTQLMGIFVHHTASNTSSGNDISYMLNGPGNPISNGLLDRDGVFHIIAAGASNHAGRGGGSDRRPPWITSKGRVPENAGNSNAWGIECANAGTGQPYPRKQQDSYTLMCAALCDAYGLVPSSDIIAHYEWTDRKCDPTGPSRFCTDNNHRGCSNACLWNMDAFRTEVASLTGGGPTPPPTPTPGGDEVLYRIKVKGCNAKFVGFLDGNGLGHTVSWVKTQPKYDQYGTLKAPERELDLADLAGLWLVGPLPTGDTLHAWTGAEFNAVAD